MYISRIFRHDICHRRYYLEYIDPKITDWSSYHRHLSILVLLSLTFAPNRGMLWQFRKIDSQSTHYC